MTELAERDARVAQAVASSVDDVPAHRRGQVAQVADTLVGLVRSVNRARARMVAYDVEWSAHMILRFVDVEGPMRAGALAACMQSDPSTVSRQVATLVREGMLERRADPGDGRASLLVLTDRARDVLADYDTLRITHFADLMADWSDRDLERFAGDLDRFAGNYLSAMNTFVDRLADQNTTGRDH